MDINFTETPPPVPPKEHFLGELIRFAIIALLIVFPIRLFVAQPFIVAGASMEPAFENGQYLIIDEITYRLGDPERGDVIIFRYPRDPSKFFIKRIIALPGETIQIESQRVIIRNREHPEGIVLDESYVVATDRPVSLTVSLADSEYFVLGDNRDASSDSRVWGALDRNLIIGRAFLRLLPLHKADIFPGADMPAGIGNDP